MTNSNNRVDLIVHYCSFCFTLYNELLKIDFEGMQYEKGINIFLGIIYS